MLSLSIKRLLLIQVLLFICHSGFSQILPRDPNAPKENKKLGHTNPNNKTATAKKVKWLDSTTINDEKLGHIKVDMKLFKEKALQKTGELSNYIAIITNKNTGRYDKNKGVDQACKLFVNEEASVEVSNVNTKKVSRTHIRTYLTNLTYLYGHFEKVVVEYVDITYVPEFRKGVDGNFYSVVTFVQKFEGFIDGKLVYGDLTKKDLTVVLKNYTKVDASGVLKNKWDVYLSDIGVQETVKMVNTFN
jgi:hypothetical protein